MNQQVFFENIRSQIIENLRECESELKIAVAWFTDKRIIKEVNDLINNDVKVEIIIYDDHVNKKDLFKNLYYSRAKIFLSKKLIHNKFCIIDNRTVINGSYNWTINASTNEENIQITYDNYNFAEKFSAQFDKLAKSCKSIDDFFEYSLESLDDIDWEFRSYLSERRQSKFPYFYSLQTIEISESNKLFKSLKTGFYLIKNENEEEEFLRVKYFVESKYSLSKINKILNRKISLPQFYDYVPALKTEQNAVFFFNQENFRVETWNRYKYVFLIDKENNLIGEKIQFTNKLPNGLYLQNFSNIGSKKYIVDIKLKKYELDMISVELHNEIGIFGERKTKKYGDEYKCGLKDFLNKIIVGFNYDHFEINEDKNEVNFIEFPHFKRDLEQDKLIQLDKKSNDFKKQPYKTTTYNFKRNKLSEKPELIISDKINPEDFLFLSDENDYYLNLYVALKQYKYGRFKFLELSNLSYSKFLELKKEFRKEYSSISFLEQQERELEIADTVRKQFTKEKKEGCYVATMVYGNYDHPNVLILRKFRDKTLKKHLIGRVFIRLYYKYSPNYVNYIKDKKYLNLLSSMTVKGIVSGIKTLHNIRLAKWRFKYLNHTSRLLFRRICSTFAEK
ncbi:MAG: CFI-box-CTERM domain-containing protein [Flavobacteriales bacterium]